MKKIKIDRAIQERPATRKQTRNEKIRQSLTEHVDVQVIPAITDREGYEKPKLRVCAYCRVSTDMDTQALSYELQVQNYTDYIRGNVFFVKHFSLKKASEFPVFSEGFSLL